MAHAVLQTDACTRLESRGETRRNPSDVDIPEIGHEVAAARALPYLADRLLGRRVRRHRVLKVTKSIRATAGFIGTNDL